MKDFKIYAYKFYAGKTKDGLNAGSIFNKEWYYEGRKKRRIYICRYSHIYGR